MSASAIIAIETDAEARTAIDATVRDRMRFPFETSMPGVFAAGDVRKGSVKRLASAVGEGSVAIQMLHQLFAAEQFVPRGRPGRVAAPGRG
jgi:thioredoxin reductase (NADPH)